MSDKLIEIAKSCGASVSKTFFEGPHHVSMSEAQLHAYTEQVCKQMVEALESAKPVYTSTKDKLVKSGISLSGELKHYYISPEKVHHVLATHKEMMGDRHE